jgi:hypothetical protein
MAKIDLLVFLRSPKFKVPEMHKQQNDERKLHSQIIADGYHITVCLLEIKNSEPHPDHKPDVPSILGITGKGSAGCQQ